MKTIVFDCKEGNSYIRDMTDDEIKENKESVENEINKKLLENLKPTSKEILMAELELNNINLLLEMGVI